MSQQKVPRFRSGNEHSGNLKSDVSNSAQFLTWLIGKLCPAGRRASADVLFFLTLAKAYPLGRRRVEPVTSYKVSFFKNLLSSDGHQFKCLQGTIEIRRARSVDRAVQAAERRFARFRRVSHWMLHADNLDLEIDGKKIDYRPNPAKTAHAWYPSFTHGIHY